MEKDCSLPGRGRRGVLARIDDACLPRKTPAALAPLAAPLTWLSATATGQDARLSTADIRPLWAVIAVIAVI